MVVTPHGRHGSPATSGGPDPGGTPMKILLIVLVVLAIIFLAQMVMRRR